jgi:5-methylcytosine-specific restriction endonuclease McrA
MKARTKEYLDRVNAFSRERNIRRDHQNDTGVVHGTKVFFSEDWYLSDAWKKLRYQAIVKYGNRCKCCGRGPKDGVSIHVDHIRPKSLWPSLALNIDNLQILCSDCNLGKGNKDRINWGTI